MLLPEVDCESSACLLKVVRYLLAGLFMGS